MIILYNLNKKFCLDLNNKPGYFLSVLTASIIHNLKLLTNHEKNLELKLLFKYFKEIVLFQESVKLNVIFMT